MEMAGKSYRFLFLVGVVHAQINLSPNGTALQSSTYMYNNITYNAILAVTGEHTHNWYTRSCSTTAADKTVAWWMLTFPSATAFVSNVVIYYRSDTPGRLAGYSLYITNNSILQNSTNPPTNGLCFHHDENELPNILQNITCNQIGNHVIIYNERKIGVTYPANYSSIALLELCDVQIIGCYKSWWGDGCRKPCPSYCIDNHCYPDNGTCVWGCNSSNCLHGYCTNNGICTDGCIKGHAGLTCLKRNVAAEKVMVFTSGGSETQSTQITDGDKTEPSCVTIRGSDARLQIDTGELRAIKTINIISKGDTGYHEYSLSISNSSGIITESLTLTSQNLAKYTSPYPVNEHNLISEVIGRYVLLRSNVNALEICEVEIIGCPSGFYGDQCDISCPSKCDGACNPENGHCVFGCKNGYFGSQCEKLCVAPQYGRSCSETCHCLYQPCNAINGTCPPGGCEDGWEGQNCSKECGRGRYGKNCKQTCEGCLSLECDAVTGICKDSTGCRIGWEHGNPMCTIACTPPQFGVSCNGTCHCINQPCDFITGVCPSDGCQEGWIGQSCSTEILCRTDNLPNHLSYFPSLSVHRYRQNVTFYCASGFYGTSVNSTCGSGNTWIPSPPKCSTEVQGDGVSVPLFVSVLVSVIVIAVSANCGMCMYYRRKYGGMSQRQTNDKYDDLTVHRRHEMTAETNETSYEELGANF